jgi:hypothetical protein
VSYRGGKVRHKPRSFLPDKLRESRRNPVSLTRERSRLPTEAGLLRSTNAAKNGPRSRADLYKSRDFAIKSYRSRDEDSHMFAVLTALAAPETPRHSSSGRTLRTLSSSFAAR